MPPKKILRLDSSQRKLPTFFNTTAEQNHDTVSENNETDETDGSCETTGEGASKHSSSLFFSGGHTTHDFKTLKIT